ncbi:MULTISPECIES: cupin domain-containing protein [Chryseobacterium]|uniref:Quercetin dioxygenase-like cupin family protein n=1 Tax=Chryseobacterium geocarposphaerae TaxID=1416776 RepID=A0ABU1LAD1_9FLAO|nr:MULTISPECIES: cupin domain-containing protein [Chryseobacterium]MDR6403687.1 quercetin dioxygenase-like cupin family protein [Chryseobacterium geocarposphaerae]MDR6697241.1 quercetin dioxygenase-like cupin family protein [Chryseobacterium ginsenosidimutans]
MKIANLLYFAVILSAAKIQAQSLDNKKIGDLYPEDIKWTSFPAFPPSARIAVLVGDPNKAEPYLARVSVPAGTILMPHIHPENRIYTVISGVFYIGIGIKYDPSKLKAYPPGSVVVLPGNTPHFHWARSGAYVTQVTANGPLGLSYINPVDDPRNNKILD